MSKTKITYVLSHPIQYISPLLKQLALNNELEVYYMSDKSIHGGLDKGFGTSVKWDVPLLEGYKYIFIKNYSKRETPSNRFFDLINPGVIKCLFKTKSKIVVVNGWSYLSYVLTIITAFLLRKKVWLRAENPLNQELLKSKKLILIKKLILKYGILKLIDKFLFIGEQNKGFFEFYGVRQDQLVFTPYSVDNDFFDKEFMFYKDQIVDLKKELQFAPDKKVILFCGKYTEQKRPMDLLVAFDKLKNDSLLLVFVGEGRLRPEMEAYIKENSLDDKVILTGFVNQSAISKYYSVADVFVMCSGFGETWGLSVNEAMNFELPVLVSDSCGCSYDLVKNGLNGFTFKEGDIAALAKHMACLINDDDFRKNAPGPGN